MTAVKILNGSLDKCDRIAGARSLLLIMKVTGIWQWRDKANASVRAAFLQNVHRCVIHLPATFIFCFLMWIEALRSPDLVQAGNVLYISLALGIYNVKLVNILSHYTRAWNFINNLEFSPIYELLTPNEKEMWISEQRKFHIVVIIFLSVSFFSGVFAFVSAVFADDYQLGYPYYVPFDWRNPRNYWFAYAYDVLGITVSCFSNVALDMFGCYIIFHIGLLYKLLSLRIEALKTAVEEEAMEKLMHCLQLHRSIKRTTKECEALISIYVLSQIIFSALIICFCGYRIQKINIMENLGQFIAMLQFMSVMILEIFLPCYFANEITVNSTGLLFNIYSTNWSEFSVRKRKFILLYMEFFKHPVRLRAGNYFEIGLPIFTKVMNNAYSFFALLLNVDK